MGTRDTHSENFATANGYDVSDRASDYTEEVAEGDEIEAPLEGEAERLSYAVTRAREDVAYWRALLRDRPLYQHHRIQYEGTLAGREEALAKLEERLAAALEEERGLYE